MLTPRPHTLSDIDVQSFDQNGSAIEHYKNTHAITHSRNTIRKVLRLCIGATMIPYVIHMTTFLR